MNRIILILVAMIFGFSVRSSAGTADLFSVDADQVYSEMHELIQLDNYLNGLENIPTLSELVGNSPALAISLGFSPDNLLKNLNEGPLGIPSFWWGFAGGCIGFGSCYGAGWLGAVAVLIVYLVTEDKEETKKALWGCLAGTVVGFGIWFVLYVVWWGLVAF